MTSKQTHRRVGQAWRGASSCGPSLTRLFIQQAFAGRGQGQVRSEHSDGTRWLQDTARLVDAQQGLGLAVWDFSLRWRTLRLSGLWGAEAVTP